VAGERIWLGPVEAGGVDSRCSCGHNVRSGSSGVICIDGVEVFEQLVVVLGYSAVSQ
jgi:hypothetical protein